MRRTSTVTLPAVGQAYQHPDRRLSTQTCKNWIPEINQETSVILSLQPFIGATISTTASGSDRGMTEWNGALYKVVGSTLYRQNSLGDTASVGTIAGLGRCTFPASTKFLVIVSSGFAYGYDGATLTAITGLESPNYGAFLNNQWIYDGNDGEFNTSNAGDPFTNRALSYADAESSGDPLVRPYVFRDILYLMGTKTIEQWYNSGVGDPPFDRIEGGTVPKGLLAGDSVSHNDDFLYFVGDDRRVYQMFGAQVRAVSTPALDKEFADLSNLSSAIGFCYTLNGTQLYQLHIPSHATYVYSQNVGWFELTYSVNELPYPATSYAEAYGRQYIADGCNVLYLDNTVNTFNDLPMIKERTFGLFSAELFGQEVIGRKLFISEMLFIIKGSQTTLGQDATLMLDFSRDGYVWSNIRYIALNKIGDYIKEIKTHRVGRFTDYIGRIRISDDSDYSLHRVAAEVRIGN